jgi:hypothetical protein
LNNNQHELIFNEEDDGTGWGQGWGFWVIWIAANAVGWSLTNLVRQAIFELGGSTVSQISTGLAIGLCLGFAQWFVLLTQPTKAGLWWVLSTIAGWGIGWSAGWWLGWSFFSEMGFGVVFATIGAVTGLSVGFWQWLVLRDQSRGAIGWIAANMVGWSVGLMLTYTVLGFLGQIATGIVAGAITGAMLIWLLRHRIMEN